MEAIRRQAKECADKLLPRATSAGTAKLFLGALDIAIDLAISLDCYRARTTGTPGNGILFEMNKRGHAGQFSFFAARRKMDPGVVALAISDNAVAQRASELHALVHDLCRHPGVPVAAEGKNTWPTVGFTTVAAGEQIIQAMTAFLLNKAFCDHPAVDFKADPLVLRSIKERRGQTEFRQRLIAAYDGRCAITGCNVVDALEAAHIIPHSADGAYDTSNGLLLRADIHTLFDLHLLSVCPYKNVIQLNPRLKPAYGQFEGKALQVPRNQSERPNHAGLMKHYFIWKSLL